MNKEILQYRTFQNGVYVRLAMQNTSTGITLDSKEQAKYYIDKEYSNFKFSILDKIDQTCPYLPFCFSIFIKNEILPD